MPSQDLSRSPLTPLEALFEASGTWGSYHIICCAVGCFGRCWQPFQKSVTNLRAGPVPFGADVYSAGTHQPWNGRMSSSCDLCHSVSLYASMPLSCFSCRCLQMSLQGDAWGATAADTFTVASLACGGSKNASRESSTYAYDCSISIRV